MSSQLYNNHILQIHLSFCGSLILEFVSRDRLMLWNGTDMVDVDLQITDSDDDEDDHVDIVVYDD